MITIFAFFLIADPNFFAYDWDGDGYDDDSGEWVGDDASAYSYDPANDTSPDGADDPAYNYENEDPSTTTDDWIDDGGEADSDNDGLSDDEETIGFEIQVTYTDTYTEWLYDDATGESWEESIDYEYTTTELIYTDPYNPDSDGDLLPDGHERDIGFNPDDASDGLADPDHDGLSNGHEYLNLTDRHDPDSDDDTFEDGLEVLVMLSNPLDSNDPAEEPSDEEESTPDTGTGGETGDSTSGSEDTSTSVSSNEGGSDPTDDGSEDDESGGAATGNDEAGEASPEVVEPLTPEMLWKNYYGIDPADPSLMLEDFDGDGLTAAEELTLKTSPLLADSDRDGLGDGTEVQGQEVATYEYAEAASEDIYENETFEYTDPETGETYSWEEEVQVIPEMPVFTSDPLSDDGDGDLYGDAWEWHYQLNALDPFDLDSTDESSLPEAFAYMNPLSVYGDEDQDGVLNREEFVHRTDPFSSDTDGDGITDFDEINGVSIEEDSGYFETYSVDEYDESTGEYYSTEVETWVSNVVTEVVYSNPALSDTDGDNLPDGYELDFGFNPNNAGDGLGIDADGDGLPLGVEYWFGSSDEVANGDSDGDGLSDYAELVELAPIVEAHHLIPSDPKDPVDGAADYDGDGVSNVDEYIAGTNLFAREIEEEQEEPEVEPETDPEEAPAPEVPEAEAEPPVEGGPDPAAETNNTTSSEGGQQTSEGILVENGTIYLGGNSEGGIVLSNNGSSEGNGTTSEGNSTHPNGEPIRTPVPPPPLESIMGGLQTETRVIDFFFSSQSTGDEPEGAAYDGAGYGDHWDQGSENGESYEGETESYDDSGEFYEGSDGSYGEEGHGGITYRASAEWRQNRQPDDTPAEQLKPVRQESSSEYSGWDGCLYWVEGLEIASDTEWLENSYNQHGIEVVEAFFDSPDPESSDSNWNTGRGTVKEVRLVNFALPDYLGDTPEYEAVETEVVRNFLKIVKTRPSNAEENDDWEVESVTKIELKIPEGLSQSRLKNQPVDDRYLLVPPMEVGKDSKVILMPIEFEFVELLEGGATGDVVDPKLSSPSPVIDVSDFTAEIADTTTNDEGEAELNVELTLSGTIDDALADITPGADGQVSKLYLIINDELTYPIPVQHQKNGTGQLGWKQYDYTGHFDEVVEVEVTEGVNTARLVAVGKTGEEGYSLHTFELTRTGPAGGENGGIQVGIEFDSAPDDSIIGTALFEVGVSATGAGTETAADSLSYTWDDTNGVSWMTTIEESSLIEWLGGISTGIEATFSSAVDNFTTALFETAPGSLKFQAASLPSNGDGNGEELQVSQPEFIKKSKPGVFQPVLMRLKNAQAMGIVGMNIQPEPEDNNALKLSLECPEASSFPYSVDEPWGAEQISIRDLVSSTDEGIEEGDVFVGDQSGNFPAATIFTRPVRARDGDLELLSDRVDDVMDHWKPKSFTEGLAKGIVGGGVDVLMTGQRITDWSLKKGVNYLRIGVHDGGGAALAKMNLDVRDLWDSSVDVAELAATIGEAIGVEHAHAADYTIALITQDDDKVAELGGRYEHAMGVGAEVYAYAAEEVKSLPPPQQGIVMGVVVFEILSTIVPASKVKHLNRAGSLDELAKGKISNSGPVTAVAGKILNYAQEMVTTKMCFVAGTLVMTSQGSIAIEEIQPGVQVWARDEFTKAEGWKPVVQTFVTHPTELLTLAIDVNGDGKSDETFIGTGEHPFWVEGKEEFLPMRELVPGMVLSLAERGETARVLSNTSKRGPPDSPFTTYNFEVADFHTYFVGESGVWVHNEGSDCQRVFAVYTRIAEKLGGGKHVDAYFATLAKMPNMTNRLKYNTYREAVNELLAKDGRSRNPPDFISTPDGNVNVGETIARIYRGEKHSHRNDTTVFKNREGLLPDMPEGYYREYVVPTPGINHAGLRRIVEGLDGELYYSHQHYADFTLLN